MGAGLPFQGTFNRVLVVEVAIAAAVFAIVASFLLFGLLRRRASRNHPSGPDKHPRLEGAYVLVLIGIASFLAWFSISANHHEQARGRPVLVVKVTAFQWCWRFSYLGTGASVSARCGPGGTVPSLLLPVGEPVRIEVTSADVVHEFWVPALGYKTEAMPNHLNSFTVTLTRTGRYLGRCSEFCGEYHSWMDFVLQAVRPAAFVAFEHAHAALA